MRRRTTVRATCRVTATGEILRTERFDFVIAAFIVKEELR